VKLVPAVRGGVVIVPVGGSVPLQPPEAVQVSALEAFHCSVTDAPMATLLSFDCRLIVGTAMGVLAVAAVDSVNAFDDDCPLQAASALRAVIPKIDLMANTAQTRRLPQIEFIPRLPRMAASKLFRGADFFHQQSLRSHIHSIFRNCQPVAICKLDMFSDEISSCAI
jgi:hypothetical protein